MRRDIVIRTQKEVGKKDVSIESHVFDIKLRKKTDILNQELVIYIYVPKAMSFGKSGFFWRSCKTAMMSEKDRVIDF